MIRLHVGRQTGLSTAVLTLAAYAACGEFEPTATVIPAATFRPPSSAEGPTAEREDLRVRLSGSEAKAMVVELEPGPSMVRVSVHRGGVTSRIALLATSAGEMGVRATPTGALSTDDLEIDVGDIQVSKEAFPPSGIHLTNIHASVRFDRLETQWMDGGSSAAFEGHASLRVEWMLRRKEELLSVRPLDLPSISVEGSLTEDERGRLNAEVGGSVKGMLLDWGGVAELSDLSFELAFVEPAPE